MSWVEKVGEIENLYSFLDDWKSREDIQIKFGMTPAESYSVAKMLMHYKREIMTKQNQGRTKKAMLFKCRRFIIDELEN